MVVIADTPSRQASRVADLGVIAEPRTAAIRSNAPTIGTSSTPENFVTIASEKQTARPAAFIALMCLEQRHRKYSAPNTKQVIPRSVVTSEAWAVRFGDRVYRMSAAIAAV